MTTNTVPKRSSRLVHRPDGTTVLIVHPRTEQSRRRQFYEHLSSRQCWEIRKRLAEAEDKCFGFEDDGPVKRAIYRAAVHYGVSPGTVIAAGYGDTPQDS